MQQPEEAGGKLEERAMTSFEAISMLDAEGIKQLQTDSNTLSLDFDPQAGLTLFYATFDGK